MFKDRFKCQLVAVVNPNCRQDILNSRHAWFTEHYTTFATQGSESLTVKPHQTDRTNLILGPSSAYPRWGSAYGITMESNMSMGGGVPSHHDANSEVIGALPGHAPQHLPQSQVLKRRNHPYSPALSSFSKQALSFLRGANETCVAGVRLSACIQNVLCNVELGGAGREGRAERAVPNLLHAVLSSGN